MTSNTPRAGESESPLQPTSYRDLVTRVEALQGRTRSAHLAAIDAMTDTLRAVLLRGGFETVEVDEAISLTEVLAEQHARLHDDAVRDKFTCGFLVILATIGTAFARDALTGHWLWGGVVMLTLIVVAISAWVIGIERRLAAIDRLRLVLADVHRVVMPRSQGRVRVVSDGESPRDVAMSEASVPSQLKRGEGSG